MSCSDPAEAAVDPGAAKQLNAMLARFSASELVAWVLENGPAVHVLSSSFGAQAAVSLHLVSRLQADIRVILIDTGYLFPETYRFIDQLVELLSLNLKVYSAFPGPAWHEARHGSQWEQGVAGIEAYNHARKVAPMHRALAELGVGSWFAGLRRSQSRSRASIPFAQFSNGLWKWYPLADWTDVDVEHYLEDHGLPRHPLCAKGYVSIGDTHTTQPAQYGVDIENTRFFGLKRECGLHGRP